MKKLVFVTQNKDKIADAQKLLSDFEVKHVDFDIPEIQSFNIREIAEHKIKLAYEKVKKTCFVMDSGLYLDCLNGFPGPLIRWYFETVGPEKICQIAQLLKNNSCHWTTILGFYDGKRISYFEETVKGSVAVKPQGTSGYSWDNIIIPEGINKTFAEMSFEEKQSYAVTKKVFDAFNHFLIKKN